MFGSEKQRPRRTPDGGHGMLSGCSSSFCSLTVGTSAKRVREVTEEQMQDIVRGVRTYVERAAHRKTLQLDS